MLILSQDGTSLVNMAHIESVVAKGRNVYAFPSDQDRYRLGEYANSDIAEKVVREIGAEYSRFFRCDGGPLLTRPEYVQPFMFEPPKLYKMPPYNGPEEEKK